MDKIKKSNMTDLLRKKMNNIENTDQLFKDYSLRPKSQTNTKGKSFFTES